MFTIKGQKSSYDFGNDPLKLGKILWVIHNERVWCGLSEKVFYPNCRNLSSLIENYIMEGVRSPSPDMKVTDHRHYDQWYGK